jgi:ribosomal protein S18 acetylase RimI-like enzyme
MADETTDDYIYLDPNSRFEIRLLTEDEYPAAAAVLAPATGKGTSEAALEKIAAYGSESKFAVYGGFLERDLVAAYVLRRDGMANDVALIAVVPEQRKRGIGKILLQDALRRSGKRPLAAETDEDALGFYKACGFKLVGRRPHPSGVIRYRVGWHAPGVRFKGGTTPAMDRKEIGPIPKTRTTGEES